MAVNPMLVGGIGVGVTAVAVTGGLYAGGVIGGSSTSQVSTGSGRRTPVKWRSLSQDSDETSAYTGKYAENYKRFLVGIGSAKNNSEVTDNNPWWKDTFDTKYSTSNPTTGEGFVGLDGGSTGTKTLKTACEQAYKGTVDSGTKKIKYPESGTQTTYSEVDIWKLCSPLGGMPKTFEANESYAGALAKDTSKNTTFISITSKAEENKKFWEIQQKQFKVDFPNSTKDVKTWCKDAYGTAVAAAATSNEPTADETNVFKWCTLSGKKAST